MAAGRLAIAALATCAACSFTGKAASDGGAGSDAIAADASGDAGPDAPPRSTCLETSWCKRKVITIHHDRVTGGPHASFPLRLRVTDADLKAARGDGHDFVFTTGDGTTRLPYERTSWNAGAGDLGAWIAVPSVNGASDTTIFLYYGNALAATDQAAPTNVWSPPFQAVYHLDTDGADATANRNDGTLANGVMVKPAKFNNGLTLDGKDDQLAVADSASLDSVAASGTLSAWVNWKDPRNGTYQRLLESSDRFTNGEHGFEWAVQDDGDVYFYPNGATGGGKNYDLATNPFTNNVWEHVAVTYDLGSHAVVHYLNGVALANTEANTDASHWTSAADLSGWMWGGNTAGELFEGQLDEIRVTSGVRSPGWLATEYTNGNDPATFSTLGPEQVLTP